MKKTILLMSVLVCLSLVLVWGCCAKRIPVSKLPLNDTEVTEYNDSMDNYAEPMAFYQELLKGKKRTPIAVRKVINPESTSGLQTRWVRSIHRFSRCEILERSRSKKNLISREELEIRLELY